MTGTPVAGAPVSGTPVAGVQDGSPEPVAGSVPAGTPGPSVRSTTDIRFAVLVAAVLASSVVALGALYLALPAAERLFQGQVAPCLTRVEASVPALPGTQLERAEQAIRLTRQCLRPFVHEQAVWVGAGVTVEVALAALLYALHPWWLVRRRRLTPLAGPDNADVRRELDDLARDAGLARPPVWLLAPYATTHGGQAFGLRGRRRVCLDVGLLVHFDLDRAGFRAVVRHELAHLRNRDVGRTYLTIAIWWSFVVVALAPFVALSFHPNLLLRPLTWPRSDVTGTGAFSPLPHRLAALLVLTVVVYLVRNAVLRARELHADAVAARWDAPDGALTRVVGSLPWPPRPPWRTEPQRWHRLRTRVGTHPSPARRLAGIADPGRLNWTGRWEIAGQGLVLGLALNNVSLFAVNLLESFVRPGMVLLALPFGVLLVALLARAVQAAATTAGGAARRDPPVLAVAVATGFAASGPLSLVAADPGLSGRSGVGGFVATTVLLTAGAVVLAAWVWSVLHAVGGRPAPGGPPAPGDRATAAAGRRPLAVLAVAVAVGAPLVALWHFCVLGQFFDGAEWGGWPRSGGAIGWYATLAEWTGVGYPPRILLLETPIPTAGLVLLWVVPAVLLGWWRRGGEQPTGVTRALVIGGAAGLLVLVAGLALPYLADAVLPLDVRRTPPVFTTEDAAPGAPQHFFQVYYNTYLGLAALAQAGAAAAVGAASARLRPVLVPIAVTTTAVVATAGLYASWAVAGCLQLLGPTARGCGPRLLLPDSFVAYHLHGITSWGVLAAVPAAVFGAGLASGWRRGRRPATRTGAPRHRAGPVRAVTAVGAGVLAASVLAAAAAAVPSYYRFWQPDPVAATPAAPGAPATAAPDPPATAAPDPPATAAPGAAAPSTGPTPTPGVPTSDTCLIGTWREVSNESNLELFGGRHRFTGGGFTHTFRADGTVSVDAGSGVTLTATIDGRRVDLVLHGRVTARYRAEGGTVRYTEIRAQGVRLTLKVDGVVTESKAINGSVSDDRYTCAGDTLTQAGPDPPAGDGSRVRLRRIGPGN